MPAGPSMTTTQPSPWTADAMTSSITATSASRSRSGLFGSVGERFTESGVYEQRVDDVADPEAGGNGKCDHRDELGGVAADDRSAEDDARGRVGQDLHETTGVAVDEGLG